MASSEPAARGHRWDALSAPVRVALIGKYTVLSDAYLSVVKALQHAAMAAGLKLQLDWVDAQLLEEGAKEADAGTHEAAWAQVCVDGLVGEVFRRLRERERERERQGREVVVGRVFCVGGLGTSVLSVLCVVKPTQQTNTQTHKYTD